MGTTLKQKAVTTRKPHQCFSCLRVFPPKTTMVYWAGIYEGDFNSVHYCLTCQDIFSYDTEGDGFMEGYTTEMLNRGETPEQLLERLKNEKVKDKLIYGNIKRI